VFEAAPPATDTELDRSFAEQENSYRGITAREVAAAIMEGMRTDNQQIIIRQAQDLYEASLHNPEVIFKRMNE
jgi:short-subunit dehydrogenase involved in D-alanine esterification of teichoic acids